MTNEILKLKTSLTDAISEWLESACEDKGYEELNTHVSDNIAELMSDAAFSVLLAQSELTKYYKEQEIIQE